MTDTTSTRIRSSKSWVRCWTATGGQGCETEVETTDSTISCGASSRGIPWRSIRVDGGASRRWRGQQWKERGSSSTTSESADSSWVRGTSSGAHTVGSLVRSMRARARTQCWSQAFGSWTRSRDRRSVSWLRILWRAWPDSEACADGARTQVQMDRGASLSRAKEAKKCGLQSLSDRESSIVDFKN